MLYLAIPAHNEAATIGVLLWRLRTVLAEFPREYEAVVYDDASSDSTSEILESYARVMPLTVLRGERRVGYAGAVDALVRHVARDTRYPRRDAMLLLQGDFTDSPTMVPEFVKRFEGGMDVVVGERGSAVRRKAPTPVRRLMRAEPWLLRFLVRADGIRDLTSSYRLVRISVLRDLLRTVGDGPVCAGDARTANADLLMRLIPLARRVESLPVEPTWEVRLRETRVVAVSDGMTLLRWAWKSRGQRAVPSSAPEPVAEHTPRHTRGGRAERDGRPELRLESRADSNVDAAPATENARSAASRESRPGRIPRPGKTEERLDKRTREPKPRTPEREPVLLSSDEETAAAERTPRRKRSRRGGRDRESARAGVDEGVPVDEQLEGVTARDAAEESPYRDVTNMELQEQAAPNTSDVILSAGLADAVEDVESELDGDGRQRPRRKRRRRGSRSGKRSAAEGLAGEGDLADGGAAGSAGAESAFSDDGEGDDAREASDGNLGPARHRRGKFRDSAAPAHDDADGSTSDIGEAPESDASNDEGPAGESAEARTRRRGRRGRRGGSRRSRVPRGEGAEGSGEEPTSDGDSPSMSSREPSGPASEE
ncbi:MAG: glycosyltransferase family 2 protein [Phycisphaerae bacterium]|nr:glycosyltransferase family 2 protein [Gemmatimonadaceae bacterium]